MRGPFLPIYGSGALIMLLVCVPFKNHLLLTFLPGMIGATLLELATGAAMEALFRVRYWDYSERKLNYKGYICLEASLLWGVFTVLMNLLLHRPVHWLLTHLPPFWLQAGTAVITLLVGTDFLLSFLGALNLRRMLDRIEQMKTDLAVMQRRLDAMVAFSDPRRDLEEKILQTREKMRVLVESRKSCISEGFWAIPLWYPEGTGMRWRMCASLSVNQGRNKWKGSGIH